MRRPRLLWAAIALFGVFLSAFVGFWLWAEFGFERTMVIYEAAKAPEERAVEPGVTTLKEAESPAEPEAAEETPAWLLPVRWGTLAAAAAVAAYIIYLEAVHRRRQRAAASSSEDA